MSARSSNLSEKIISLFQSGKLQSAQEVCADYIDQCKTQFMEELTLDTATNFAGSVLLFSQLCAAEKKPWKATLYLNDANGCIRFLEDFMTHREMLASTCFSFASAYEYAAFFPEASQYYQKAIRYSNDVSVLEEALFSYLLMTLRIHDTIPKRDLDLVREKIDSKTLSEIKKEAKDAFSKLIATDPIEKEQTFLDIRYEVEKRVDAQLLETDAENVPFCIRYWTSKKQILQDEFGITWRTPAECNPDIKFQ